VSAREEFQAAVLAAVTVHGNGGEVVLLDDRTLDVIYAAGEAYRDSGQGYDRDAILDAREDALVTVARRFEDQAARERTLSAAQAYLQAAVMARQEIDGGSGLPAEPGPQDAPGPRTGSGGPGLVSPDSPGVLKPSQSGSEPRPESA
jgi:hypothetical protein